MVAPASNGAIAGSRGDFNRATRPSLQNFGNMTFTSDGSDIMQLPQVGFLSELLVNVTVNLTTNAFTGTVTAGTASKISPYSLIKQIVLRTNDGSELYRTSGSDNYIIQRLQRTQYDPLNLPTGLGITTANEAVTKLPGAFAVSTAYVLRFTLRIPVAWNKSLQAGLILLQNPTTRLSLELQFGNSKDMLVSSDGSLAPTVFTATITVTGSVFQVPRSEADYPSVAYAHRWISEQNAWTNARNEYKPPLADEYLSLTQSFFNTASLTRPDPAANITQMQLRYAQSQVPYSLPVGAFLAKQQEYFGGLQLPDGVFHWSFTDQFGLPEIGGRRDTIDTDKLTDMAVITDWGSLALSGSPVVVSIREVLSRITS